MVNFPSIVSLLATFASVATAVPAYRVAQAANPAIFLLAGDSTTATQATNGGGWGDGFLNTTLHASAKGTNYGRNGRTTVSFRSDGYWDQVIAAVKSNKASYQPYVTIQFGHNDQKADKGISVAQFQANLEKFVSEVKAAGGTAILVTPLSRRSFSGGKIVENLAEQAAATKAAAKASGAPVIDLNRASTDYLNKIGETNAHKYNLNADDNTHLNKQGSIVFGSLVSGLIDEAVPALKTWTYPVAATYAKIQAGQYVG